jgi:hypothetical protein
MAMAALGLALCRTYLTCEARKSSSLAREGARAAVNDLAKVPSPHPALDRFQLALELLS